MIRIQLQQHAGSMIGFLVNGHADYAPHGQDIVCAAVSALAQGAVLGLTDVVGLSPQVAMDEDSGTLSCHLPSDITTQQAEASHIILQTFAVSVRSIEQAHPQHIQIEVQAS